MPEYTLGTILTMIAVIGVELFWLKTGIFRSLNYWLAMAVMFAFQIPMDGFLTRLSNPIVRYNPDQFLGIRWPLDIPIEDFGFGFAMMTLTLMLWTALRRSRREPGHEPKHEGGPHEPTHS